MASKKLIPAIKKYEAGIHRFFTATSNSTTLDDLTNSELSETLTVSQGSVFASNLTLYSTLNADNIGLFRNRIINGDMRIDQRGKVIGTPGTGAGSSSAASSTVYSVDRWAIANGSASGTLCAAQVTLTDVDQAAVEGRFTSAVAIGVSPVVGLSAYMPFNSNILDVSGNGVVLTATGSMAYAPGRVSGTAVYLANEANVIATPTAAANYLTSSYILKYPFSVSFWVCLIKSPTTGNTSTIFITNTSTSVTTNNLIVSISLSAGVLSLIVSNVNVVSWASSVVTQNTWYHIGFSVTSAGAMSYYLNGTLINTYTFPTFLCTGILFGNNGTTSLQPFAGYIEEFRIYNRALSPTEVAALANVAPVTVAPTNSLTTRLTFDNVTTDAQGTLPAPVATGTTTYSASSKSGTASLNLTGNTAGGTMTVGQTYTLSSGSFSLPLSMGGWINASSVSAYQVLFCLGNNTSTNNTSIQLVIDASGRNNIYVNIGGIGYSSSSVILTASTWYYVSATFTNSYLQFYINGVMVSSRQTGTGVFTVANGTGSPTQMRIGGQTGSSLLYAFKGYVDDVRIYNRELSLTEVAGLYYSYQNAAYMLYQQPIEGLNVADLAWGTSAAQSATVSAWIKNNTASTQQFSLSAGNAGAVAAIAAVTFETSSGINDTLGFLTNPVGTNVVYSESIYKVGTRSLDLTANTVGGTPSTSISYNYNYSTLPLSVSMWIYPTAATATYTLPFNIGGFLDSTFSIVINSSSQIYTSIYISGVNYSSSFITITLSQWLHVAVTLTAGVSNILYLNGVAVVSTTLPSTALVLTVGTTTSLPTTLKLGYRGVDNTYAYKGYIDDVRIFEKALTATEVYQIYNKNVTGTTVSQYLLPRSYIYTTPSIPAGAWQKISFTIPGDTTDAAWAEDTTCGVNLALCLGASAPYVGSDVVGGWSSAQYFTGDGIQLYGASSNNFLADTGNSIYLTGVQFEKGAVASPFELRPYSEELQLCLRYYETMSIVDQGGVQAGSQWGSSTYKVIKRVIPTFSYSTLAPTTTFESAYTYTDSFRFTRTSGGDRPFVLGLRLDAEL